MIAVLASLGLISSALPQVQEPRAPPPWLGVHTYPPSGRIMGSYDCEAGPVVIELTVTGLRGPPQIKALTVGDQSILDDTLIRWNGWLNELAAYETYSVRCRGAWVAVSVAGTRPGDGEPYSISIFWREGRVWRAPQSVPEWGRAEREGWSRTDHVGRRQPGGPNLQPE